MPERDGPAFDEVADWVERLTGVEASRAHSARASVSGWGILSLQRLLVERPTLDSVVALTLLAEGVEKLTEQGVPQTKLLKKLREARAPEAFWPVWTELRAAAVLLESSESPMRLRMEPGRPGGAHADFRVTFADGSDADVEFKTIGLSQAELDWQGRAGRLLDELLPPVGLTSVHARRLDAPIGVPASARAGMWAHSAELNRGIRAVNEHWGAVRGASVVAHGTADGYMKRVARRVAQALAQLPAERECWLALWWSNGASNRALLDHLAATGLPANVSTIVVLGQAVIVPSSALHVFTTSFDPHASLSAPVAPVRSLVDDRLAGWSMAPLSRPRACARCWSPMGAGGSCCDETAGMASRRSTCSSTPTRPASRRGRDEPGRCGARR